ncbi:MAG: nucleotidyltransferase family protein [Pseudomonadota bacterium]
MSREGYTAVVLAAQRRGADDPLAPFCDNGNKCLIDMAGKPMVEWVLDTLLSAPQIARIVISSDDETLLAPLPRFDDDVASGRISLVASGPDLFASVEAALAGPEAARFPAIITTADNPLLTPAMLEHFCAELERTDVDAAIAMTPADLLRAEHPNGQRRFYAFTDGEFSNCNLYALTRPKAVGAAAMFRGGGQFRKKAMRIVRAFGVFNFLLYFLHRLSLDDVGVRLSKTFGCQVGFVRMPFSEACIDVDNERTMRIARKILEARITANTPAQVLAAG